MNFIKLFRRSTNTTSFLPEIDGLRFFAIFTVLVYHMNTAYIKQIGLTHQEWRDMVGLESYFDIAWWIIRLDVGVKVFFAISGFILALPFLKQYVSGGKQVQIKDYFIRRLTRLEPPFVISLIGFYFVHVFLLQADGIELIPHFFAGLIYGHVFIFGEGNPINPVTWSLETEAQFYIVLPLLFWILFQFKKLFLQILFILLLIVISIMSKSYFFYQGLDHVQSSILAYFTNFASGILFAWVYLKLGDIFFKNRNFVYDLLGLLSVFLMFYFYKPQAYWLNNIILNLSILGLFLSVFKGNLTNWFYTRPIIYIIGGMCYSIYLLHFAFFHLIVKFTGSIQVGQGYWQDFMIQSVIMLPLVLVVSSIYYLLIEKPCMNKDWPTNLYKTIVSGISTLRK